MNGNLVTAKVHPKKRAPNGRCEVRFLGVVTFFDVFSLSSGGMDALVQVLSDLGVQRVAMHPGKFQADTTEWPLLLVEPASV